jgi:hypothetical protein
VSTAIQPPMASTTATDNITDKTICLNVSFGRLGNNKKVATSEVEADTDKSMLHVSKTLLESPELKAVDRHDKAIIIWLKNICLPSLFRNGIYLVPIAAIPMVEEFMKKSANERSELVKAFMQTYAQRREESKEKLQGLYDPTEYPGAVQVASSFVFEWNYITFSTPGKLKDISADFFEQEKAKAESKWSQATEQVQLLLRVKMKELVDHMLERLEPGEDGKAKRFHESNVTNLKDFMETFSLRNISDDAQLQYLIDASQKILDGVDVKDLRKNEVTRDCLQKGFTQVKTFLDTLVEEAGSRKINLGDWEE